MAHDGPPEPGRDLASPRDRRSGPAFDERVAWLRERIGLHPFHGEISPQRLDRMLRVAATRLASVTVVLENLWDPHNVSAVLRSAEGLGLSEAHLVDDPHPARLNRAVLRGAQRWLTVQRHASLGECLALLSERGFLTCAADVGAGCVPLHEIGVEQPIAVLFGTEKEGLTPQARRLADLRFTIPMTGMTGSFNVSVSAAISLFDLSVRRRRALAQAPSPADAARSPRGDRRSGEPHTAELAGDLEDEAMLDLVNGWLAVARSRRTRGRVKKRRE